MDDLSRDEQDLARFGYKQELKRSLGVFSSFAVAGSVFQWTKYLAGKTYSWFAGWIYLFAGILTVASVCATLPVALIPAFDNMGWNLANTHANQRWIALA